MAMIQRPKLTHQIETALARKPSSSPARPTPMWQDNPGAGLSRSTPANYFDLEDPVSLARPRPTYDRPAGLADWWLSTRSSAGLICSRCCACSATVRRCQARFLILGSATPDLLRQSSESLAGRLETVTMAGFSLAEVGSDASCIGCAVVSVIFPGCIRRG